MNPGVGCFSRDATKRQEEFEKLMAIDLNFSNSSCRFVASREKQPTPGFNLSSFYYLKWDEFISTFHPALKVNFYWHLHQKL